MKTHAIAALLLAAAALAGCGAEAGNSTSPAAPVAAVKAPAGQAWTDVVTKTEEGFKLGNPDAPIKLVEYGSRLCPACQGFALEAFEPLSQRYISTGKVSYEFREFLVHGIADFPAALLGRCVGTATFFPVLDRMFRDQPEFTAKMTPAFMQQFQGLPPQQVIPRMAEGMGYVAYMAQRGLPEAQARACLTDQAQIDFLAKQTQDRGNDGTVSGTPTLLVNGRKVESGPVVTWADAEKALKAAGA